MVQKKNTCCCNDYLWRPCLLELYRSHSEHFASICVSKWKWSCWNTEKKSEKNLGYFSVLDPHKHSDIIHFHMLNWKGEDLKFQRPIYLPLNLPCLFLCSETLPVICSCLLSHSPTPLLCFWPSPARAASLIPSSSGDASSALNPVAIFF